MKKFRPDVDAPEYKGGHAPYDIIKEGTIALVVIALLTVLLASLFGSPDEKQVTIKTWSNAMPIDFATTAINEMNGTTTTAGYGPPYNHAATGQDIGFLHLAQWVGVRIPLNTTKDFVVSPLESLPAGTSLTPALATWNAASKAQRSAWVTTVTKEIPKIYYKQGLVVFPDPGGGPLPVMIDALTAMARSGASTRRW